MATKQSPLAKELLSKTREVCDRSIQTGDFTTLGELVGILGEVVLLMQATLKEGAPTIAKKGRKKAKA